MSEIERTRTVTWQDPLAALAASVLYFELRGSSAVTATDPAEPMPNPMGTA